MNQDWKDILLWIASISIFTFMVFAGAEIYLDLFVRI